MKYLITRQGFKTPRSKKMTSITVATFNTLQDAINTCKASGMVYSGSTYLGDFLQYSGAGSTWTIMGEFTLDNGSKLVASYNTKNINL